MEHQVIKFSEAVRYKENPFLENEVLKIDRGTKTIIAGSTRKILVDTDSGEAEAIALLHKSKEVDRNKFVKLFINEVQALFDLSKCGLKVFGFVLTALRINDAKIYINISQLCQYCGYKQRNQAYKGLGELMANKIIAMSSDPNLWFINPNVVFNGDRIAFVKEYRLKQPETDHKQIEMFERMEPNNKADEQI